MKKPELLAPAGNMECLKAAVQAGCDAVYLGGKHFGARAFSNNFTNEELVEAINYCHLYGVKVYVTVNTMITEELVKPFIEYIDFLAHINVDAIIISDIGMIDYIRKTYPNLKIHISTQTHIHNLEGTKFMEELGVERVVLARETNLELIKKIKESTNVELEIFVHGALCICYSGQCLMSSLIGGRSGNKGTCAGSCRLKYGLYHDDKKINKDDYILSTRDLNTLDDIGKLIDIGIDSVKIEGRMKSKEYVYYVTKLYRKAIDNYTQYKDTRITEEEIINLKKIFNRTYTKGFLNNEEFITNPFRPNHIGIEIGKVISNKNNFIKIKLNDELNIKDGIRFLSDEDYGLTVYKMKVNNKFVDHAFKDDIVEIKLDKKIKLDSIVVKTTDNSLVNEIDDILKNNRKIKIDGKITCKLNEPIILEITDGVNNIKVSDFKIEKSLNRPTTKEDIKKQISKLGSTIYEFNNLEIISDDNIFINIKDLNEIRRQAISLLNDSRLYEIPYIKKEYSIKLDDYKKDNGYTYLITDKNNINKCTHYKEIITDDIDLSNELNCTLKLPRVMYEYPEYDKKLLVGEFGSLYKYKNVETDFSFNIANSYSVAFMHSIGVDKVTLSIELNESQIQKLIENYILRYNKKPNVEVIVSLLPEVMIMKNNLIKQYNLDNKNNYITDKFNNKFKVEEKNGLTYIYYYKKIDLDNYDEIFNLGVNNLRIEY